MFVGVGPRARRGSSPARFASRVRRISLSRACLVAGVQYTIPWLRSSAHPPSPRSVGQSSCLLRPLHFPRAAPLQRSPPPAPSPPPPSLPSSPRRPPPCSDIRRAGLRQPHPRLRLATLSLLLPRPPPTTTRPDSSREAAEDRHTSEPRPAVGARAPTDRRRAPGPRAPGRVGAATPDDDRRCPTTTDYDADDDRQRSPLDGARRRRSTLDVVAVVDRRLRWSSSSRAGSAVGGSAASLVPATARRPRSGSGTVRLDRTVPSLGYPRRKPAVGWGGGGGGVGSQPGSVVALTGVG